MPAEDAERAAVIVQTCDDSNPNRFFLTYLFTDQAVAIEFLQDVGLLQSQMPCNTCGQDMAWTSDSSLREGFRWRCQRRVAGTRCNQSASTIERMWHTVKVFLGQYNKGGRLYIPSCTQH
jgi:hypothetical protein